jgi:hypothetical protein
MTTRKQDQLPERSDAEKLDRAATQLKQHGYHVLAADLRSIAFRLEAESSAISDAIDYILSGCVVVEKAKKIAASLEVLEANTTAPEWKDEPDHTGFWWMKRGGGFPTILVDVYSESFGNPVISRFGHEGMSRVADFPGAKFQRAEIRGPR